MSKQEKIYDQNNQIVKVDLLAVHKGRKCKVREIYDNGIINIKYIVGENQNLCPNVDPCEILLT